MPPLRISVGGLSETWAAPARDGIDSPLILERTLDHLGEEPEFLQALETQLRALGSLPPPFRPFIEVSRSAGAIEVLQERFIGVSGRRLVQTLWKNRRLLPIDVWLTLAVGLCRAWASVSRDSPTWPLVPNIDCLGLDVRRRLMVFPEPDHSIEFALSRPPVRVVLMPKSENLSPEHVDNSGLDERSRVFSLATVLVQLLTGARPLQRDSEFGTTQALSEGGALWRPADHEGCSDALAAVLSSALARERDARPASPEALAQRLIEGAGCQPASLERAANVVLAVDFERARQTFATLRAAPEFMPHSWRNGGLDVLEDQLLEALVPLEQLPANRGVAPMAASTFRPPRFNLAPPARRSLWQALWPFRRS